MPVSAEFVARYREREEQERAEKEKMKRMVLDIHDRQEEEDYQGKGWFIGKSCYMDIWEMDCL